MLITNPFTGEQRMSGTKEPETIFEAKREEGLKHLSLHQAELIEYGEPGPDGKRLRRPKSVGKKYDIPPNDGTYSPDQVDKTGAEYVDINKLMEKYDPSGKQFSAAVAQGFTTDAGMRYDNFVDAPTLQEALDISIHAQQQFDMLDARLRNRFENNPINFLNFVNDPNTLEEQYKLGIRVKKVEPPKDATLSDVVKAVQESGKPKKTAPKGGDTDE